MIKRQFKKMRLLGSILAGSLAILLISSVSKDGEELKLINSVNAEVPVSGDGGGDSSGCSSCSSDSASDSGGGAAGGDSGAAGGDSGAAGGGTGSAGCCGDSY